MALEYKAPPGTASTIGGQLTVYEIAKKAIIDAKKDMVFSQLSTALEMPKNMGKTIKIRQYIPVIDPRNVNDQGLDASGAAYANGNLYGSSRDIGTINSKLPTLVEGGGAVNRIGFTRIDKEGAIYKFGFYFTFTKDSIQFDSDEELMMHLTRESVNASVELSELLIQRDILNGATTITYAGNATSLATVSGETSSVIDVVAYKDLEKINKILDKNRTPKQTTIITGTRLVDTKVVRSARYAYIGHDLENTIRGITDPWGGPAFISVEKYAAGTTIAEGEIGAIGAIRFIVVHDMLFYENAGATVTTNDGYLQGSTKYNVYPILIVGDDSFVTIGFQDDGANSKFLTITKKPGPDMATISEPYGVNGLHSIQFWHGTVIKRPERIGILRTLAKA